MILVEILSYCIFCKKGWKTPKRDHEEQSLVMETLIQGNKEKLVLWYKKPHFFKILFVRLVLLHFVCFQGVLIDTISLYLQQ